ncbi:hypothetical protein [Mycoplasma simbae]|uniref:hypothetical protein n=1 Tax=Mycoplasma simbae TaxID=36744 RepID=UPI000497728D|nr:hypothetical protein [Mycoplasma simbae]
MKPKNKKILSALLISGIPAIALAVTVPLLKTNAESVTSANETTSNNRLHDATVEAELYLKQNNEISDADRQEIQAAIKLAKQLLRSKDLARNSDARSVIRRYIEQRQRIDFLMANATFSASVAKQKPSFEPFKKLIKTFDLRLEFDQLVKDVEATTLTLDQAKSKLEALIAKENNVGIELELTSNIFELNVKTKQDNLHIQSQVAVIKNIIEFINERTSQSEITRDAISSYETLLKSKLSLLYAAETTNNETLVKAIYTKLADAKDQVAKLQLDSDIKAQMFAELDNLEAFVSQNKSNLALKIVNLNGEQQQVSDIVDEYLSGFWAKTSQYFNNIDQTKAYLEQQLQEAKKLSSTIPAQFKQQLDKLTAQADQFLQTPNAYAKVYEYNSEFIRDFNSIKIALSVYNAALNNVKNSNLSQQEVTQFNDQLNKFAYSNLFDYVANINSINSKIDSANQLKEFFSAEVKALTNQYNLTKQLAASLSLTLSTPEDFEQKLSQIFVNKPSLSTIANNFEHLANISRQNDKVVLAKLVELLSAEYAKDTILDSPKLFAQYEAVKPIFVKFAAAYSTATRAELSSAQPDKSQIDLNAIYQAHELLEQGQVANKTNAVNADAKTLEQDIIAAYENDAASSVKQDLINQVRKLATQAKLIEADKNLTTEQKLAQLEQVAQLEQIYKSKIAQAKSLDEAIKQAEAVLEKYKDNETAKIYFAKEVKKIADLKKLAQQALQNPADTQFDLEQINNDLKYAMQDFGNKIEEADGNAITSTIRKQIGDTFSAKRTSASTPTAIESKLYDALDKLKEQSRAIRNDLAKDEVTKQNETQKVQNKLAALRAGISSLDRLETQLQYLASDSSESQSVVADFKSQLTNNRLQFKDDADKATFQAKVDKVEQENAKIQAEIDKINNLINTELFNPEVHNKEFIEAKTRQIEELRKQIASNIANLKLDKEKLLAHKHELKVTDLHTTAQITDTPYSLIVSDFDAIKRAKAEVDADEQTTKEEISQLKEQITQKSAELDKLWKDGLELTDEDAIKANKAKITELEKQIKPLQDQVSSKYNEARTRSQRMGAKLNAQQDLLAKLKQAAVALSDLDQNKYPELAQNLEQAILASRASLSDESGAISSKILALNEALAKVELNKESKDELDKLVALKRNQFKENGDNTPRAIFAEFDAEIQQIIDQNQAILSNPNSSESDLNQAKESIKNAWVKYTNLKDKAKKAFDSSKQEFESLAETYYQLEKAQSYATINDTTPAQGSEIQKLRVAFEALASTAHPAQGQPSPFDTLTPEKINEFKDKLLLAFNKDKFNNAKAKLAAKVKSLDDKIKADSTIQANTADGKNPAEKVNEVLEALSTDVDARSDAADVTEVLRQIAKLNALDTLVTEQDKVVDKIKETATDAQARKFLTDALVASNPIAANTQANGVNPTTDSIQTKFENLHKALVDSQSLDEYKAETKKEIDAIKTAYNEKHDAETNIDAKAKEEINKLLDQYKAEVDSVQRSEGSELSKDKEKIGVIDAKAQKIKAKLDDIVEFAKAVKTAQDLTTPASTGQLASVLTEVKNEITAAVTEAQSKYGDTNSYQSQSEKLAQLGSRLAKLQSLNTEMGTLNTEIESLTYQAGTAQSDESSSKKDQFKQFFNKLKEFANTDTVKKDESKIQLLNSVVNSAQALVGTQKTILEKHTLAEFSFEGQRYGYETDQKNIGQAVLSSVPTVPTGTFNPIELNNQLKTLQEQALSHYDEANILYLARKAAFEASQSHYNNDKATIEAKKATNATGYDELLKDLLIYHKHQFNLISQVANYADRAKIDQYSSDVTLAHSLLPLYIQLADAIIETKAKKQEASSIQNKTQDLTNILAKTDELVESIEKANAQDLVNNFYFQDKNTFNINAKLEQVKTNTSKIALYVKHAEKKHALDSSTLAPEARKILDFVLNKFASTIASLTTASTAKLESLLREHLEGGPRSFSVLFESSKQLDEVIKKAKSYTPTVKNDAYYNNESTVIKEFYRQLEEKTAVATDLLNTEEKANDPDLQTKRLEVMADITNDSYGLIAKIKNEKLRIVNETIYEINTIDKYIADHYTGVHKPEKAEFKALELRTQGQAELNNFDAIKTLDTKYRDALSKITTQKQAIVTFNKNMLTVAKDLLKPYLDYLKGNQFNVDNMNKTISSDESNKLINFLGYSAFIDTYWSDLNAADGLINKAFAEVSFTIDARLLQTHFNKLINHYKSVKNLAKASAGALRAQIVSFNDQMKASGQGSANPVNLYDYVELIDKRNHNNAATLDNALSTKITDLNAKTTALPVDFRDLDIVDHAANIDFNNTIDATNQNNIKEEFKKFYDVTHKVLESIVSANNLIYGSSETNTDGLQGTYNHFITNRNFAKMLELIASTSYRQNAISNSEFQNIIITFEALYNSLKTSNKPAADALLVNKNNSFNIKLGALETVFKPALALLKWSNDAENKKLLFNNIISDNAAKMHEITPAEGVLLEDVQQVISQVQDQANQTQIEITNRTELLAKFAKFNILKNTTTPFNTDNVKVYLTRSATSEEWLPTFLQSDTSIKKTRISLKVKYIKPTSGDNFFNDVEDFEIDFHDIWITFKTLDSFRITLDDMRQVGNTTDRQNNDYANNKVVFEASKAGWNNQTYSVNLMNVFAKNSSYMKNHNFKYIREDVTFDGDQWEQSIQDQVEKPDNVLTLTNQQIYAGLKDNSLTNKDLSTSSSLLKYKIKMNETGTINAFNKNWVYAPFLNKKFFYWLQASSDLTNNNTHYTAWIPYFVALPVVDQGNSEYAVMFMYYENKLVTEWNTTNNANTAGFKNTYDLGWQNNSPNWYVYKPTNDFVSEVDAEINQIANIQEDEKLKIKANIFAQRFFFKWANKTNIVFNHYDGGKRWKVANIRDPHVLSTFDKYEKFVRIREKGENNE